MIRYKVKVLKLRQERTFLKTSEIGNFFSAEEGDTFGGYSHNRQKVGRHFDLWLNNPQLPYCDDRKNLISFGRIDKFFGTVHGEEDFLLIETKYGLFKLEVAYENMANINNVH